MIEIEYVLHDCFVVRTGTRVLLFDYWRDPSGKSPLGAEDRDKSVTVFVSHGHKDHYNPEIFGWSEGARDIRYVVSRDVWRRIRHILTPESVYRGPKVDAARVTPMKPGDSATVGDCTVYALLSTDIGNSYLICCGGKTIFHAGDLNAWTWRDESTEAEIDEALQKYNECLDRIEECMKSHGLERIDYCFFPVDSRIGSRYWEGAGIFLRRFDVDLFFPMHCGLGDDEERESRRRDALMFSRYANPQRGQYVGLLTPGDRYCDCRNK